MTVSQIANALGARGGRARAQRLSEADRQRIASLGGHARRQSMEAARRIEENLRYAAAVVDLQGGAPRIARRKTSTRRLPGIYLERD